ncbi:MAG: hypothetical protein J6Q69_01635 [Clostridia bacterium]|nr:hypothetical protein [Clostridia bacterium]
MPKTNAEEKVKLYLKNKAIELGAEGYASWAAKNLPDLKSDIYREKRDDDAGYARSLSGYGRSGAALSDRGLANSGYAGYVDNSIRSVYSARRAAQDASLLADPAYGMGKYEDYLTSLSKKEEKLYVETVKSLISSKVVNYKEAYDIALESGLTDKRAREAARESTDNTKSKLRKEIINAIVYEKLTREQAFTLATSGGLDKDDATELGRLAEGLNQLVGEDADQLMSYVEYLKKTNTSRK